MRLHHVLVSARAGILLCVATLLCPAQSPAALPGAPHLAVRKQITSNDWPRLDSSFHSNAVLSLEASTNLNTWQPIATLHDALFDYPDAAAPGYPHRLYRLQATERSRTNDWKNQIWFPEEPFRSRDGDSLRFVKFAILLNDPTRVHYQHSTNYPFHFEFATARLAPFLGMDRTSFDAISLH